MSISSAADLVRKHEGCILTAQPDAKGMWVIGIGHDIPAPDPGTPPPTCSQAEADELFGTDLAFAKLHAKSVLGADAWAKLNPARQAALTDMAFELGGEGLAKFVWMLAAIRAGVWAEAQRQALQSAWHAEVPGRSEEDAAMLLTGCWPS